MKTIIASLIAVSVLGLVAVPASALDAQIFCDRLASIPPEHHCLPNEQGLP